MSKPTVLFVCVHNAGRSQMAAGYLRHLGGGQIDVLSAGSAPAGAGSNCASIGLPIGSSSLKGSLLMPAIWSASGFKTVLHVADSRAKPGA